MGWDTRWGMGYQRGRMGYHIWDGIPHKGWGTKQGWATRYEPSTPIPSGLPMFPYLVPLLVPIWPQSCLAPPHLSIWPLLPPGPTPSCSCSCLTPSPALPQCSFLIFLSISPHMGWSYLTCSAPCKNNIFHLSRKNSQNSREASPFSINKVLYESPNK